KILKRLQFFCSFFFVPHIFFPIFFIFGKSFQSPRRIKHLKYEKLMCGIVGYLGRKDAWPLLFNGLKRLEYRGYDSAGIALIDYIENQKSRLHIFKAEGNVHLLEEDYKNSFHPLPDAQKYVGIGHSRWATHGGPSYLNAHPHVSSSGRLIMVHNGIIENNTELKHRLPSSYESSIKSETDSEI